MLWYALQTRSNTEELVEGALQRAGIECFYPYFERTDSQRRVFRRAFFPGYVFAKLELDYHQAECTHLWAIPQVIRIIGYGAEPMPIPDQEIINVRLVTEYAVKIVKEPTAFYSEGSPVRVISGPLTGAKGTVMRVKNATKLVILVSMLNQAVSTEVDAITLEVVPQKKAA